MCFAALFCLELCVQLNKHEDHKKLISDFQNLNGCIFQENKISYSCGIWKPCFLLSVFIKKSVCDGAIALRVVQLHIAQYRASYLSSPITSCLSSNCQIRTQLPKRITSEIRSNQKQMYFFILILLLFSLPHQNSRLLSQKKIRYKSIKNMK